MGKALDTILTVGILGLAGYIAYRVFTGQDITPKPIQEAVTPPLTEAVKTTTTESPWWLGFFSGLATPLQMTGAVAQIDTTLRPPPATGIQEPTQEQISQEQRHQEQMQEIYGHPVVYAVTHPPKTGPAPQPIGLFERAFPGTVGPALEEDIKQQVVHEQFGGTALGQAIVGGFK